MPRNIYAIIDNKAQDLLGQLTIHRADAAAIRFFGDIMGNASAKHQEDYDLLCLGAIVDHANDPPTIDAETRTVLTGATWLAAQQQTPHHPQLELDTK